MKTVERAAISLVAACLSAAALYAVIRAVEVVVLHEPDPTTVMWAAHTGYFWRVWTAAYASGMVALLTWTIAVRAPERTAGALARSVFPVACLVVAQAVLAP